MQYTQLKKTYVLSQIDIEYYAENLQAFFDNATLKSNCKDTIVPVWELLNMIKSASRIEISTIE